MRETSGRTLISGLSFVESFLFMTIFMLLRLNELEITWALFYRQVHAKWANFLFLSFLFRFYLATGDANKAPLWDNYLSLYRENLLRISLRIVRLIFNESPSREFYPSSFWKIPKIVGKVVALNESFKVRSESRLIATVCSVTAYRISRRWFLHCSPEEAAKPSITLESTKFSATCTRCVPVIR